MKERVYLFGAYFGNKENGEMVLSNYILDFPSMPTIDDIKNTLKNGDKCLKLLTILSMQFLTKEQFLALKGVEENTDEQKELLDKKIDDSYLSIRIKNIYKVLYSDRKY